MSAKEKEKKKGSKSSLTKEKLDQPPEYSLERSWNIGDGLERWVRGVSQPQFLVAMVQENIMAYVTACHIKLVELANPSCKILRCFRPEVHGIKLLEGNPAESIFALVEICIKPRIVVYKFEEGEESIVSIMEGAAEAEIRCLRFSKNELLVTISGAPEFAISVWKWDLGEQYVNVPYDQPTYHSDIQICPTTYTYWVEWGPRHLNFFELQPFTERDVVRTEITLPENEAHDFVPDHRLGSKFSFDIISAAWSFIGDLYVLDEYRTVHLFHIAEKTLVPIGEILYDQEAYIYKIVPFGAFLGALVDDGCFIVLQIQDEGGIIVKSKQKFKSCLTKFLPIPTANHPELSFYGITDKEKKIECVLNGKLRPGYYLLDFTFAEIMTACFIEPDSEYVAVVTERGIVYLLDTLAGNIYCEWKLDFFVCSILSHPLLPYAIMGSMDGCVYFMDIQDIRNPQLIFRSFFHEDAVIDTLALMCRGRFLLAADSSDGLMFLQFAFPTMNYSHLDQTCLEGTIRTINTPMNYKDKRFQVLIQRDPNEELAVVLNNFRIDGDRFEIVASQFLDCTVTSMCFDNHKKFMYCFSVENGLGMVHFTEDMNAGSLKEPEVVFPTELITLDVSRVRMVGHVLCTFSQDGWVMMHEPPTPKGHHPLETLAALQTHYPGNDGIRDGVISLNGCHMICFGTDNTLVHVLIKPTQNAIVDWAGLQFGSAASVKRVIHQQMYAASRLGKQQLEWKPIQEGEQSLAIALIEENQFYEIRSFEKDVKGIMDGIEGIRVEVKNLMELNDTYEEIEKLPLEEFELDEEEEEEAQIEFEEKKKVAEILAASSAEVREEWADQMKDFLYNQFETKGATLTGFNYDKEVSNYPLKPIEGELLVAVDDVKEERRLEKKLLKSRKEILRLQNAFKNDLRRMRKESRKKRPKKKMDFSRFPANMREEMRALFEELATPDSSVSPSDPEGSAADGGGYFERLLRKQSQAEEEIPDEVEATAAPSAAAASAAVEEKSDKQKESSEAEPSESAVEVNEQSEMSVKRDSIKSTKSEKKPKKKRKKKGSLKSEAGAEEDEEGEEDELTEEQKEEKRKLKELRKLNKEMKSDSDSESDEDDDDDADDDDNDEAEEEEEEQEVEETEEIEAAAQLEESSSSSPEGSSDDEIKDGKTKKKAKDRIFFGRPSKQALEAQGISAKDAEIITARAEKAARELEALEAEKAAAAKLAKEREFAEMEKMRQHNLLTKNDPNYVEKPVEKLGLDILQLIKPDFASESDEDEEEEEGYSGPRRKIRVKRKMVVDEKEVEEWVIADDSSAASDEEMDMEVQFDKAIDEYKHKFKSETQIHREDFMKKIESGGLVHNFFEPQPGYYPQMETISLQQHVMQMELIKYDLRKLKVQFNEEFENVRKLKETTAKAVISRNERIREICEYVGLELEVLDPEVNIWENAERIFIVTNEEVPLEPYLTPEEREELERLRLEEEARRLANSENWRERALMVMMDGVLERSREAELKKDIPKPKFMLMKEQWEWNYEDYQKADVYFQLVEKLELERAEFRKELEIELRQLLKLNADSRSVFDKRLAQLFATKMHVENGVRMEEMKLLRLTRQLTKRERFQRKEDQQSRLLRKVQERMKDAKSMAAQVSSRIAICNQLHDQLVDREKNMYYEFRSTILEAGPYMETFVRLYKKSPKIAVKADRLQEYLRVMLKGLESTNLRAFGLENGEYGQMVADSIQELDEAIQIPVGCPRATWEKFCKLRRQRCLVEFEAKLTGTDVIQLKAVVEDCRRREDDIAQEMAQMLAHMATQKNIKLDHLQNGEMQMVLPKGRIEAEISRASDFADIMVTKTAVIQKLNAFIQGHTNSLIAQLNKSKAQHVEILQLEWRYKRAKLREKHLEAKKKDIATLRITKEVLEFIRLHNDFRGMQDRRLVRIRKLQELTELFHGKYMAGMTKLQQMIQAGVERFENNSRKKDILLGIRNDKFNIQKIQCNIEDPGLREEKREERMQLIMRIGHMARLYSQFEETILTLETELERLYDKTYPYL